MSVGLIALLDDVAAIAKLAATSLDDVVAQSLRAGVKSAGVVIDDAAVTPRYVIGLEPARELPLIARIARGSLRNKLVILLPVALLLAAFAPWAITPLLMLGGAYLCYEGAEKVYELVAPHAAHAHEAQQVVGAQNAAALEDAKVGGAIRTDFILSAEIMAIALASIPDATFVPRVMILATVGVALTILVYGSVAVIVKADDVGLGLAQNTGAGPASRLGRIVGKAVVRGMPAFLKMLGLVGTVAMVWVGGGIVVHGLETFGLDAPAHAVEVVAEAARALVPVAPAAVSWIVTAFLNGVAGLLVGFAVIPLISFVWVPGARAVRGIRRRFT